MSICWLAALCGCGVHVAAPAAAAPTVFLSAAPATVTAGGTATLNVSAGNATSLVVSGSDGTQYSMGTTGGTKAVTPATTTTYTAMAVGAGGKTTATATVTVTPASTSNPVPAPPPAPVPPAPTVAITAGPASISANDASTLTVTASNAAQLTLSGSDGTTYSLPAVGGTQRVSPAATTTYTATAAGPGGKATAVAVVTVAAVPAPSVTVAANPTAITASASSLLTITAANAAQVSITGSDGSSYTLPGSGGTEAVSPSATTTYTVDVSGPGGKVQALVTVTVTPNPAPTVTLQASPDSISAGATATLSVNAANATKITLSGSDGSSYTAVSSSNAQFSVSPSATTTYTALATGPGGMAQAAATVTITAVPTPAATLTASPSSIIAGNTATLTVTASNATAVTLTGDDGSTYTVPSGGGAIPVTPSKTTTYTLNVSGQGGHASAGATVTVNAPGNLQSVDHVLFMLQENHSFDNYFGMLNPYRAAHHWDVGDDGQTYTVDGIDDKLSTIHNQDDEGDSFSLFPLQSTCIDDLTSSWLESYGDVSRYDFSPSRAMAMDGFVHTAEGYAHSCTTGGTRCAGSFTDVKGQRAMGYYDENTLNYYYWMASQFAVGDRWFTPVSSKSVPNRIATFTGGTTQGLAFDPGNDDGLQQLDITSIFKELDGANVTWKIYYTVTLGNCLDDDECAGSGNAYYPSTIFSYLQDSYRYLHGKANPQDACPAPTMGSSVVGDASNSFCIDPTHIAPLDHYYNDVANGTLPAFAFIEAGYSNNDEHPGSGQSILKGQAQVANIVNHLMNSPSWKDSVFFLAYDEAGGPYDHVPPVPHQSNTNTVGDLSKFPDIGSIVVKPDTYDPCLPATPGAATLHCDLHPSDPGATSTDAAAQQGFAAQIGFRVPNMIISPWTKKHYVGHTPMDHTAVLKFVENRFIGPNAHLTERDKAQPDLLDFFDFTNAPWGTAPTPPAPLVDSNNSTCHPATFAPAP